MNHKTDSSCKVSDFVHYKLTTYTSGMTLQPGYFTKHPLTNGTKQNQTVHPGSPYICGPYKRDCNVSYPLKSQVDRSKLSGSEVEPLNI